MYTASLASNKHIYTDNHHQRFFSDSSHLLPWHIFFLKVLLHLALHALTFFLSGSLASLLLRAHYSFSQVLCHLYLHAVMTEMPILTFYTRGDRSLLSWPTCKLIRKHFYCCSLKPVAQRQGIVVGSLALIWNFLMVSVK